MASFLDKIKGTFTPYAIIAADKAAAKAESAYPTNEQHNARGDAYRHLVWQALVAKNQNPTMAKIAGTAHEYPTPIVGSGWNQPSEERAMDLYNNNLGRQIAAKAKTEADIYRLAKEYVDKGIAKYIPVDELNYRANLEQEQADQEAYQ